MPGAEYFESAVHQLGRDGVRVHGVPGSSPVLLGLSQLDGEPIGVLDLGRLLDLGATGTTEHMVTIVTHVGPSDRTETVGLAADEALQIAGFEVEDEAGLGQCTVYGERELTSIHTVESTDFYNLFWFFF